MGPLPLFTGFKGFRFPRIRGTQDPIIRTLVFGVFGDTTICMRKALVRDLRLGASLKIVVPLGTSGIMRGPHEP